MVQIPPVNDHTTCQSFFTNFFAANQPGLTHRQFASIAGWPASLMGDIISGRRGISVARVVEFGKAFNLSALEIERLIMLNLKEHTESSLNEYVEDYFRTSANDREFPDGSDQAHESDIAFVPSSLVADTALTALHALLVWSEGKIERSQVAEFLDLTAELREPELLDQKLATLKEYRIIEGDFPEFKILKKNIGCKGMSRDEIYSTMNDLKVFAEDPEKRTNWQVGTFVFPVKLCAELNLRMQELRNWIINNSIINQPNEQSEKVDCTIFQYNFAISYLLNFEKSGAKLVPDSKSKFRIERADRA